jgi:hypothetical protein
LKTITLVAFRGVGKDERFRHEPALIKAGHVGIQFEGRSEVYAFRPTDEAIREAGGEAATLESLYNGEALVGSIYDDSNAFKQGFDLYEKYKGSAIPCPTVVIAIDYQFRDDEYDEIMAEVESWYNENKKAIYGFPGESDRENCATFLTRFGIPLPAQSGQLRVFIRAMILHPDRRLWKPEG